VADAPLHTTVETPSYEAAARKAGLSQADRDAVLDTVMRDPAAGDLIRGSGGVRQVRVGKEDTGKSGGYRALTFFMDAEAPVYLLWVLDKLQADNINAEQTKRLKAIAKAIKDERNQGRKAPPPGGKDEI
jgi:hypothetical protein